MLCILLLCMSVWREGAAPPLLGLLVLHLLLGIALGLAGAAGAVAAPELVVALVRLHVPRINSVFRVGGCIALWSAVGWGCQLLGPLPHP